MSEIETLALSWSVAHDEYMSLYAQINSLRFWALPKELRDQEYAQFQIPYQRCERLTRQIVETKNPKISRLEKLIASWAESVQRHWTWSDTCSAYRFGDSPPKEDKKLKTAYKVREEKENALLRVCRKIR